MKCNLCGKFRKQSDLLEMEGDSNDGYQGEVWTECRWCMSKCDLERLEKNDTARTTRTS
jgi:hypothetical protein